MPIQYGTPEEMARANQGGQSKRGHVVRAAGGGRGAGSGEERQEHIVH